MSVSKKKEKEIELGNLFYLYFICFVSEEKVFLDNVVMD